MKLKRQFAYHSIFLCGLFAILASTVAKPSFSLAPSLPSFASITQDYVGRKHAAQMKNYRWVFIHFHIFFFFYFSFAELNFGAIDLVLFYFLYVFVQRCWSVLIFIFFFLFGMSLYYLFCFRSQFFQQWYPAAKRFAIDDILSWSNHSHR